MNNYEQFGLSTERIRADSSPYSVHRCSAVSELVQNGGVAGCVVKIGYWC